MRRLFKYFRKDINPSAALAKERLQIIISHERIHSSNRANLLNNMQKELVEVIARHLRIDTQKVRDQVKFDFAQNDGHSVLELNITLPDEDIISAR